MSALAVVVMSYFPLPIGSGGMKRAVRLIEAMERAGASPLILTFGGAPEGLDQGRMRGWQVEVFPVPSATNLGRLRQHVRREPMPASLSLLRRLAELAPQSAFVEIEEIETLQYLGAASGHCPTVASLYNVYSRLYADMHATRDRSRIQMLRDNYHVGRQRALETRYARRADALFCVSEDDYSYFASRGAANLELVPNGVDDELFQVPPNAADRSDVFFFGQFNYQPNVDGMLRFLRESWPLVLERFPSLQLRVAGPGSTDALRHLAPSVAGLEVLGFVEDLRLELGRARLVLAPLWVGGGTRLKVLEALAAARPVVGTPLGVEQVGFVDGVHGLLGESPKELAEAVIRLETDDGLAQRAGEAGRKLMEAQRWSRVTESAEALYRQWVLTAGR
jgi:glycosyltransferase involved in cell wall biosynthesis